ncbi:hypothetical protein HDV05_008269, partial [Chytridiales sp. JEL 0842]
PGTLKVVSGKAVTGDIVIAGVGVTVGFLNADRGLVRRSYLEVQVGGECKQSTKGVLRFYKPGDIGVVMEESTTDTYRQLIQILGRSDFQVKIHGYRIELNEIEKVASKALQPPASDNLLHFHGVAAVACNGANNDPFLVFYIGFRESNEGPLSGLSTAARYKRYLNELETQRQQMEAALKASLPAYMVPSTSCILGVDGGLPVSSNLKLDRALMSTWDYYTKVSQDTGVDVLDASSLSTTLSPHQPEISTMPLTTEREADYASLRATITQIVKSVWSNILHIPMKDIQEPNAHFLDLGGNSIQSARVAWMLGKELRPLFEERDVEDFSINPGTVLVFPTLGGFVEEILSSLHGARSNDISDSASDHGDEEQLEEAPSVDADDFGADIPLESWDLSTLKPLVGETLKSIIPDFDFDFAYSSAEQLLFFGLDSIGAMTLCHVLLQKTGARLKVAEVLGSNIKDFLELIEVRQSHETVSAMARPKNKQKAKHIEKAVRLTAKVDSTVNLGPSPITKSNRQGTFRAPHGTSGILLESMSHPLMEARYTSQRWFRINRPNEPILAISVIDFEKATLKLVERHEAL